MLFLNRNCFEINFTCVFFILFYTLPHNSGGVLLFHVGRQCVCRSEPSIRPSTCSSVRFSFPDDNLRKHEKIFTKLGMCIDIVEMGLGLLMGKFRQIFKELSACDYGRVL